MLMGQKMKACQIFPTSPIFVRNAFNQACPKEVIVDYANLNTNTTQAKQGLQIYIFLILKCNHPRFGFSNQNTQLSNSGSSSKSKCSIFYMVRYESRFDMSLEFKSGSPTRLNRN